MIIDTALHAQVGYPHTLHLRNTMSKYQKTFYQLTFEEYSLQSVLNSLPSLMVKYVQSVAIFFLLFINVATYMRFNSTSISW